jgi:CRISPR-associated endonuclease/helicase Cas3
MGELYHLLVYHSLDVAAIAWVYLKKNPTVLRSFSLLTQIPEVPLFKLICFFMAIHDSGKFSWRFQGLNLSLFKLLFEQEDISPYILRHDAMGYIAWNGLLAKQLYEQKLLALDCPEESDFLRWEELWCYWATAVTGHHGVPPDGQNHQFKTLFCAQDQQALHLFVTEMSKLFISDLQPITIQLGEQTDADFQHFSWLLAGFAIFCDWLGSDQEHFPYYIQEMPLQSYWEKRALPQAEKAIAASGVNKAPVYQGLSFQAAFPKITTPTPLQQHIIDLPLTAGPHFFLIEEVTGSGKTEAALYLAYRLMQAGQADGFYLGLPTMATANAAYLRAADFYTKIYDSQNVRPSLILAHSARSLVKSYQQSIGPENSPWDQSYQTKEETASQHCSQWLADKRKASLLAAVGVGTLDQALLAIFRNRHQALRLWGLHNKVLIVDEVHAYDPYMNCALTELLALHAKQGGSAILLSATMPFQLKRQLTQAFSKGCGVPFSLKEEGSFPLFTHLFPTATQLTQALPSRFQKRSVNIRTETDEAALINYIHQQTQKGACICWIRNTVSDAVATYNTLREYYPEQQITLFHARFALGDRLDIEAKVTRLFGPDSRPTERQGQILIATQVVEQSLDLDFDCLITDLCPIELLIQRIGRLYRHQRDLRPTGLPPVPEAWIYAPEFTSEPTLKWYQQKFPRAANIYLAHGELWLALQILQQSGKIDMPQDARLLIESVYGDEIQQSIPEQLMTWDIKKQGQDLAVQSFANKQLISVKHGYTSIDGAWQAEPDASSRLTQDNTTFRLLLWENNQLRPWRLEESILTSQVNLFGIYQECPEAYSEEQRLALKQRNDIMSDKGKWVTNLILQSTGGESVGWAKQVKNDKEEVVKIYYNSHTGLSTHKRKESPTC